MVCHNNARIFSLNLGEAKRQFDNLKKGFGEKKVKYKEGIRTSSGSQS